MPDWEAKTGKPYWGTIAGGHAAASVVLVFGENLSAFGEQ